jgi:hypothetical protein
MDFTWSRLIRAVINTAKDDKTIESALIRIKEFKNSEYCLCRWFTWSSTSEGRSFWSTVHGLAHSETCESII